MKILVYRLAGLIGLGLLLGAVAAAQSLIIGQYTVVASKRLDSSTFESIYRAQVTNIGAAVRNVTATLTSTPPWVTVLEGTLSFGEVETQETVTSSDTFSIRHDRDFPLEDANLVWTISADPVPPPNRPPVAAARADQTTVKVNTVVRLDGRASSDPDHDPLTFQWALIPPLGGSTAALDDPISTTPSFVPDLPGQYVAQLIVDDGKLRNATAVSIDVKPDNRPPTVYDTGRTIMTAGYIYRYQVRARDPDDDPLTYGLLTAPAGMTISPTGLIDWRPLAAGDFPVVVTVTDPSGARATQEFSITVESAQVPSTALIGPAGGVIGLPDGARVDIPAGALDREITLSIREIALPADAALPSRGALASKVYALEPDGLTFKVPVLLTLPYDPSLLPPGYQEGAIYIHRSAETPEFHMISNEQVEPIEEGEGPESPQQVQDPVNKLLFVTIVRFSNYAAVGVNSSADYIEVEESTVNATIRVYRPDPAHGGHLRTRP